MVKKVTLVCSVFLLLILNLNTSIAQNLFSEKANQKIWEAKDRNDAVYTLSILQKGNNAQKILALKGLQSWSDSSLGKSILKVLKKGNSDVKSTAFEAIGQSRDSFYIHALLKAIQSKKNKAIKPQALVALGKCITKSKVDILLSISDTTQLGYGECIYRALLKGVGHKKLTNRMACLLVGENRENRFYAAWYLSRTPYTLSSETINPVFQILETSPGSEIMIPLLSALGKSHLNKSDSIKLRSVFLQYSLLGDYLMRVSALRAILVSRYVWSVEEMNETLTNESFPGLQLAYSELIAKYCKLSKKYSLLTYPVAILNILSEKGCPSNQLVMPMTATIYDKIWKLKLLENDYSQYPVIQNILLQDANPAIKTAAMESLIKCTNSLGFPANLMDDFIETASLLIKDADPGVLSVIANAILDKQLTLKSNYNPQNITDLFYEAKSTLQLPRDMEAFIDIEKVLAFLNKTTYKKPEAEWNNPINWNFVSKIPKDQKVQITTNKGTFIIQMNVDEAPGSVGAILKLVDEGYYNNKFFHRLVPNFVIQGGCPRGDGYGSLNYTIRSEFSSLKYTSGAVGLASAGANTESCQWFATHCPAPHLDGRYTIIGYVVKGMEIIHQLGVGDIMLKVERI